MSKEVGSDNGGRYLVSGVELFETFEERGKVVGEDAGPFCGENEGRLDDAGHGDETLDRFGWSGHDGSEMAMMTTFYTETDYIQARRVRTTVQRKRT